MVGPLSRSRRTFLLALGLATAFAPLARGDDCVDGLDVVILHMNDVYEIKALGGGTVGGLARVATLRKQLERENPGRVIAVLAGDFLGPSALGDAEIGGKKIAGRQMVAVLNALGLDYATFGNHEFDFHEEASLYLYRAIKESEFLWISSNVTLKEPHGFPDGKLVPTRIHPIPLPGRKEPFRLGLLGVTFYPGPDRQPKVGAPETLTLDGYATFRRPIPAAREAARALKDQGADVVVALTHLDLQWNQVRKGDPFHAPDLELAREVKEINLILGGHEHENNFRIVLDDRSQTPIFKADSNARTVYIHRLHLRYDAKKPEVAPVLERIDSELRSINDEIDPEPDTDVVADFWFARGIRAIREARGGADPLATIGRVGRSIDGRESSVRYGPTDLTSMIAEAMGRGARLKEGVPNPRYAIFNSGTIRLDDVIPAGPIRTYDVLRILPFGGGYYVAQMRGKVLQEFIRRGTDCDMRNEGGFLQAFDLAGKPDGRGILPAPRSTDLAKDDWYPIVFNDYLISEKNIDPINLRTVIDGDAARLGVEPAATFAQASGIDPEQLVSIGDLRQAVVDFIAAGGAR